MLHRRQFVSALLAAPFCIGALPRASQAAPPVWQHDSVALGGVDPTGYMMRGDLVRGNPAYGLLWRDAMWHFANAHNRSMFEMNPIKYSPQFGGYCAYSLSKGELIPADPAAFAIYEGRTYLIQSFEMRAAWAADKPGNILAAKALWPAILGA